MAPSADASESEQLRLCSLFQDTCKLPTTRFGWLAPLEESENPLGTRESYGVHDLSSSIHDFDTVRLGPTNRSSYM